MQMLTDPNVLLIGTAVIGTMMIMGVIGYVVYSGMQPRIALKKRMEMVGSIADHSGAANLSEKNEGRRQKRIQSKLKQLEQAKKKQSRSGQIRLMLLQAGVPITPQQYLGINIVSGLITLFVVYPMSPNLIIPIGAAIVAGLGLPKAFMKLAARKRQKQFTKYFADAIDVIIRGVKSGLPVTECLKVVGREFPEPVGNEFRLMVEGQQLGMSLDRLLERALERIPTSDFKFFSIVLQIQKQTGGNLAETLQSLVNVLRGRKKLKDKVSALSSEAKSSAMIIGSLPIFVASVLMLLNPDYIMLLFTTEIGHYILFGGGIWGALGVAVMTKMINFEV